MNASGERKGAKAPDGMDELEWLLRRAKDEAVAWQKFLEGMKRSKIAPVSRSKRTNPENKAE